MAESVIRDMVKNYLSVSAVKDLLELNVKVRFLVGNVEPFYETQ